MIPVNLASRFFPSLEILWERWLGMYFVKNHHYKAVGDSPYILIGSAGTELKAKNIYKKGHKSLKTQFLTCIY